MATNQAIITGPKNRPTAAVPCRWTENNATMITAVIGTMKSSKWGAMALRPSTADSTEIAGVIMLSPKNSEAPNSPSAASIIAVRRPGWPVPRRSSVISAMIPASPLLAARITRMMYVTVTMIITDQKIVDTTPYTLSVEIGTGWGSPGLKTVWIV